MVLINGLDHKTFPQFNSLLLLLTSSPFLHIDRTKVTSAVSQQGITQDIMQLEEYLICKQVSRKLSLLPPPGSGRFEWLPFLNFKFSPQLAKHPSSCPSCPGHRILPFYCATRSCCANKLHCPEKALPCSWLILLVLLCSSFVVFALGCNCKQHHPFQSRSCSWLGHQVNTIFRPIQLDPSIIPGRGTGKDRREEKGSTGGINTIKNHGISNDKGLGAHLLIGQ